ncbi:MAG: hypothetical protein V1789_07580 [PVC group bacterium]
MKMAANRTIFTAVFTPQKLFPRPKNRLFQTFTHTISADRMQEQEQTAVIPGSQERFALIGGGFCTTFYPDLPDSRQIRNRIADQ